MTGPLRYAAGASIPGHRLAQASGAQQTSTEMPNELHGNYGKAACAGINTEMFYEDQIRTLNALTQQFRQLCGV